MKNFQVFVGALSRSVYVFRSTYQGIISKSLSIYRLFSQHKGIDMTQPNAFFVFLLLARNVWFQVRRQAIQYCTWNNYFSSRGYKFRFGD